MKVKTGHVELEPMKSQMWLHACGSKDEGDKGEAVLTPGQAMKLAARLQRWALGKIRRYSR